MSKIYGHKIWAKSGQTDRAATVIANLHDRKNISFSIIGDKFGMTPINVTRYYRAFKALEQMKNDEEYGQYANPKFFTLFEEMIKKTVLKEWLGWREQTFKFDNIINLHEIYKMILCGEKNIESELRRKNGITNPGDMRNFAALKEYEVSGKDNLYFSKVVNDELDTETALHLLKRNQDVSDWNNEAQNFLETLNQIPRKKLLNFTLAEIQLIDKIINELKSLRDDVQRVNPDLA
ncbi:hypothetical protein [Acetivibrio cellulolyticus]|uniref:hypothetical protein n=1 Tax=Acetivibrio cellulolyticus TaxID=35830 RepID=UPI0001E2D0BD|nr:hypothetical protein [Acetivibrio cellulolyticus]